MSKINQLLEGMLVRQLLHINEAQENYYAASKFDNVEHLEAHSRNIAELSRGLNELSQSIFHLNKVGICEIDRESLSVFLNRLEERTNEPG